MMTAIAVYTVSQENETLDTSANNFNSPGSISTSYNFKKSTYNQYFCKK